jgi:hypothetical protein
MCARLASLGRAGRLIRRRACGIEHSKESLSAGACTQRAGVEDPIGRQAGVRGARLAGKRSTVVDPEVEQVERHRARWQGGFLHPRGGGVPAQADGIEALGLILVGLVEAVPMDDRLLVGLPTICVALQVGPAPSSACQATTSLPARGTSNR